MTLECRSGLKEFARQCTGFNRVAARILPPTAADNVLEAFQICQGVHNVLARCLMVGQYAAEPEDRVPALKNFGGVENHRAEFPHIREYMIK